MTAKAEAEKLMNELVDFAEKMLAQCGEFHPFGGYLDEAKHVVHVGVDGTALASNSGHDRLGLLTNALTSVAQARVVTAFGIVTNVSLPKDAGVTREAIKVFIEHRSGYCAEVFFIYSLANQNALKVIDTIAQAGEPIFFL